MTDQEIRDAIEPLVAEGKLRCADALALAAKLEIKPARIGQICNEKNIRIINCQLGCFGAVSKNKKR